MPQIPSACKCWQFVWMCRNQPSQSLKTLILSCEICHRRWSKSSLLLGVGIFWLIELQQIERLHLAHLLSIFAVLELDKSATEISSVLLPVIMLPWEFFNTSLLWIGLSLESVDCNTARSAGWIEWPLICTGLRPSGNLSWRTLLFMSGSREWRQSADGPDPIDPGF